jgi:hypothetical protein
VWLNRAFKEVRQVGCPEFFNLDKMNKPDDAFVLCRKLENVTDKVFNDSNMSEPTSELLASPCSCLKVAIQSRLVDKVCVMRNQSLL